MENQDRSDILDIELKELPVFRDERGWLVEVLKGKEISDTFGQVYITTAHPGKVKGNHYHKEKTEWAYFLSGKAEVAFLDVETGEKRNIIVDNNSTIVKIPPMISHGFKNTGNEMLYVLIYSNKVYDEKNPDSYPEVVLS